MTQSKKQKSRYSAARFLGFLMMGTVVAVGWIMLSSSFAGHSSAPKKPAQPTTEVEKRAPTTTAKYNFYDQLQSRSQEVQKFIARQQKTIDQRPPVKGRNYRVQVGAFRNPDQAEKMQQQMLLRKLPVRIIRSGEFHLVQVGPYSDLASAEKMQQRLENDNIKTIIKTFVDN